MKFGKRLISFVTSAAMLTGAAGAVPGVFAAQGDLIINEVCLGNTGKNGNDTSIVDSAGEYCDWVEIYNPSSEAVDITGWKFKKTDLDSSESTKSISGAASVPANGYLVVYFGKNLTQALAGDKPFVQFGITSKGVAVELLNSDSTLVSRLEVPALADDTVYARQPDGSDTLNVVYPTAGSSNNSAEAVLPPATADADVVINEVCLGNTGANGNDVSVIDTKGKYADWIELYNTTDSEIDLSGWGFTDDSANLMQAVIPDGVKIGAKGYLILYCGKNIESANGNPIGLFGLSGDGEVITICNASSEIVDRQNIPALSDDITYSRVPDGSEEFYVTKPTPGATNNSAEKIMTPKAPVFSRESGAFKDSFDLEMTAESGTDIYYTTDGSTPTVSSTLYTGKINVYDRTNEENVLSAISKKDLMDQYHYSSSGGNAPSVKVDKATVIRAIAVNSAGASEVVTKSYFVGKTNETYSGVPIISIVTDADNLFSDETGIYLQKNCTNKGREWERPVHIDYIKNNTVELSQDCGIRIQGGYSRGDYQKSLRLYARSDYGEKSFNYDFFEGRAKDKDGNSITSFKKITLRNGGNDAYYIKYKDSLLQTLVSDRDFSKQTSVPCIAFINGEYWGIYTMQEDYNDDYVEKHYGVDKDDVVMIKPDTDNNNAPKIEEGTDDDIPLWTDTVSYAKTHDLANEANYQEFAKMVDLDSFADYVAAEVYITNEDWSGKNWEVWRSRTADQTSGGYNDGRWRFMLYDVEMGAFLWGNNGESSENDKLAQIYAGGKNGSDPIQVMVYKLMQNPDFSEKVYKNIGELAEVNYNPERVKEVRAQLDALYYPNLKKYYQRFPNGPDTWSADQCKQWLDIFFYGGQYNGYNYLARDKYAPSMININKLIIQSEQLKQSDFPSDKWSAFSSALKRLVSAATSTKLNMSAKNRYYKALDEALNDMGVETVTTPLYKIIALAESLRESDYSPEDWSDMQQKVSQARTLLSSSASTQEDIESAEAEIKAQIKKMTGGDLPTLSKTTTSGTVKITSKTTAKVKAPTVAKVKKVKAKSAKKSLKVSWKKIKGAKGYIIQASAKKNFKKLAVKKTLKANKKKITLRSGKLKKGRRYYVRVRAYKTYKDSKGVLRTVKGAWSKKIKSAKVK